MKNNRAKKILSFVLAASMVFAAMAPTMSFAERDAVVKNDVVTVSADELKDENKLQIRTRVNGKDVKGTGTIQLQFSTKATKVVENANKFFNGLAENGEAIFQTIDLQLVDGKYDLDLNELFAVKEDKKVNLDILNDAQFTMKVLDFEFDVEDSEVGLVDVEDVESLEADYEFTNVNNKVQIKKGNNTINLELAEANKELQFKFKLNNEDAVNKDFNITVELDKEEEANEIPDSVVKTIKVTTDDEGKELVEINTLDAELLENDRLFANAKYTFTAKYEGVKKEVVIETNDFGRVVKVNGEDAKYDPETYILNDLVFNFDKKLTNVTRFEIENYDPEIDHKIKTIDVYGLKRQDQNTKYVRDKDGNYIESDDLVIPLAEEASGDLKDKDNFEVDKNAIKDLIEEKEKETSINYGKTDEQNILALVFTNDKNNKKVVYINADDLKDKDVIKLVNPFKALDLDVKVIGGNPAAAIEGATVELLPAELDTLGVAQYGKAIATGTTKANGKVKFEGVNLETIIKHALIGEDNAEENGERTMLPFKVVVNADGYAEKGHVLTRTEIKDEKVKINLNTAAVAEDIRIAGANRYETALKVALNQKPDGSRNVVIASGRNYADALVGARYANYQDAVLLLTEDVLSQDVQDYLAMATKKVTLLGGDASVAPAVQEELAKKYDVNRISGKDRYVTSVKVAEAMDNVESVFVASGENYADALVASAAANRYGKTAVLLTEKADLTPVVKDYIEANKAQFKKAFVFGGEGSVSGVTMSRINEYITAERVKGSDRDETAVAVANKFFAEDAKAVVASGANYADALVAGTMNQPILLVTGGVNDAVKNFVKENIMNVKVVGGAGSVSDAIVDEVVENLK